MHILGEEGFQIERIISTQKVKKTCAKIYFITEKKKPVVQSGIWNKASARLREDVLLIGDNKTIQAILIC